MTEVSPELRAEMSERYNTTRTEPVELGRVRDYLLAMDEPADIDFGEAVPPLFLLTMARTRRLQPTRGTAVKAGDQYQFIAPVHVGDTLTIEQRVTDIEVKKGKNGPMYLIIYEGTFKNQRGETVGKRTVKSFRWGQ